MIAPQPPLREMVNDAPEAVAHLHQEIAQRALVAGQVIAGAARLNLRRVGMARRRGDRARRLVDEIVQAVGARVLLESAVALMIKNCVRWIARRGHLHVVVDEQVRLDRLVYQPAGQGDSEQGGSAEGNRADHDEAANHRPVYLPFSVQAPAFHREQRALVLA
jgi:hypothetical protein